MLAETQEQLKNQRKRAMPIARGGLFPSLVAAPQPDSIACELESSLYSELSLDSGISGDRMWVLSSSHIQFFKNIDYEMIEHWIIHIVFISGLHIGKYSKRWRWRQKFPQVSQVTVINSRDWVLWLLQRCQAVPQGHVWVQLCIGGVKIWVRLSQVLILRVTVIVKVLFSLIQRNIRKFYTSSREK